MADVVVTSWEVVGFKIGSGSPYVVATYTGPDSEARAKSQAFRVDGFARVRRERSGFVPIPTIKPQLDRDWELHG